MKILSNKEYEEYKKQKEEISRLYFKNDALRQALDEAENKIEDYKEESLRLCTKIYDHVIVFNDRGNIRYFNKGCLISPINYIEAYQLPMGFIRIKTSNFYKE